MGNRKIEIQQIAGKIREDFLNKRIPKEKLARLYSYYNREVNESTFVAKAEAIFPKLNCGLASVYLKNILGGEIIQGKYGEDKHTFLLSNDWVVDITADQYGGPKVYVGEFKSPWAREQIQNMSWAVRRL